MLSLVYSVLVVITQGVADTSASLLLHFPVVKLVVKLGFGGGLAGHCGY